MFHLNTFLVNVHISVQEMDDELYSYLKELGIGEDVIGKLSAEKVG